MKNIVITGPRIFLKKLKLKDATPQYCFWLNDPQVNQFLSTKKATIGSLKQYIKNKNKNKSCLFLGIFLKKGGRHIGNIKLEPIDFKRKKATLGIMIGNKNYWGKGLGKEAIGVLTTWAFNQIGLEKIYLGVDKKNIRAIKSYQRVGFQIIRNSDKMILEKQDAARLVLGTAQFGLNYGINNKRGKVSIKEVKKILGYAWEQKIHFLDTAYGYGESEKLIGNFIQRTSHCFDICTGELPECDSSNLKEYFLKSLQRLKQKQVYGYLIHNFDHFLNDKNCWQVLKELRNQGLISKIGFSLYSPNQLKLLFKKRIKPDMVQIPYSFFDQRFAPYFPLLKKQNISIFARSIFLQGLIFKKPEKLASKFLPVKRHLISLRNLSKKENIPIAALAINFVLLNKKINRIVIGVDSLANLQENLKALKYKDVVKKDYLFLKGLKLKDEKILLPSNW